jgi:hypothetical protein
MQIGDKFTYSHVDGGYRAEEVKSALKLLCDAGIIKGLAIQLGTVFRLEPKLMTSSVNIFIWIVAFFCVYLTWT